MSRSCLDVAVTPRQVRPVMVANSLEYAFEQNQEQYEEGQLQFKMLNRSTTNSRLALILFFSFLFPSLALFLADPDSNRSPYLKKNESALT